MLRQLRFWKLLKGCGLGLASWEQNNRERERERQRGRNISNMMNWNKYWRNKTTTGRPTVNMKLSVYISFQNDLIPFFSSFYQVTVEYEVKFITSPALYELSSLVN